MMDNSLQKSIEHYRRIIEHAQQLESLLTQGDARQLQNYTEQLHALQAEAGLHDREFLQEMSRNVEHWQAHPLFQQRRQLIEQILEMNNLLLPRIRGMMSVTAAELVQLKEGRVAVSGYHQAPVRKKSIRGIG